MGNVVEPDGTGMYKEVGSQGGWDGNKTDTVSLGGDDREDLQEGQERSGEAQRK